MGNVIEKVCNERHKSLDEKVSVINHDLESHQESIGRLEEAVIMLTQMMDSVARKDMRDKVLVISMFIILLLICLILLGPEITASILKMF